MCLPHSFGWNVYGERLPGISFPQWYAEACSSHQGADMGLGHCPARPFPGSHRALRGGTGQVFDLLAISSLKRIGDLQALSIAPSCLEFALGMVKAFLHPRPIYVPKVPANVARSSMLQAFCPPPLQNTDQERHNLLCPVRALDAYVHRAALWRKNEQLFVCFGPPNKWSPASKQRMSK